MIPPIMISWIMPPWPGWPPPDGPGPMACNVDVNTLIDLQMREKGP
jgi:hypothetical protein